MSETHDDYPDELSTEQPRGPQRLAALATVCGAVVVAVVIWLAFFTRARRPRLLWASGIGR